MSLQWLAAIGPFLYFMIGFLLVVLVARSLLRNPRVTRKDFAFLFSIMWWSLIFMMIVIGSDFEIESVLINGGTFLIAFLAIYPIVYFAYPWLKHFQK
ncbi:MAG: hypothetical protein KGJ80_05400 [Chloroflexota bacterium]|nr:hypothetical protein [Chloroflexota bacterium]